MFFDPNNKIVALCGKGMEKEMQGKFKEAASLFQEAWLSASTHFERFVSAHYMARIQPSITDKLSWDIKALDFALSIKNPGIKGSFSSLFLNVGKNYEDLGQIEEARINYQTALQYSKYLDENEYGKLTTNGIIQALERLKDHQSMKKNKHIRRDGQEATKIFDNRTVKLDYRHLPQLLEKGIHVLDVGCGTGSISKDVAEMIGPHGKVVGIDNTKDFITSGISSYANTSNLHLKHVDLFAFETKEKFDLIISARTLQWLSNPLEAIKKMKLMLKPGGVLSILDYNHDAIVWNPSPPQSMLAFYECFLKWRSDAGMNNHIGDDIHVLMKDAGLENIKVLDASEHYTRERNDCKSRVGIWSKVAGSKQMVEEGYIKNEQRVKAIKDYNQWVSEEAVSMTMVLKETRGVNHT